MTTLFNGVDSGSARIREYRSLAAKALIKLLKPGEEINDVNWTELERLPSWILLNTAELNLVTEQVGVTALAPQLFKTLDGGLLKIISNQVGHGFLKALLNSAKKDHGVDDSVSAFDSNKLFGQIDTDIKQANVIQLSRRVGESVLLSTIENMTLLDIIARRFETDYLYVDKQQALTCIKRTESLVTQNPDPLSVNPPQAASTQKSTLAVA